MSKRNPRCSSEKLNVLVQLVGHHYILVTDLTLYGEKQNRMNSLPGERR